MRQISPPHPPGPAAASSPLSPRSSTTNSPRRAKPVSHPIPSKSGQAIFTPTAPASLTSCRSAGCVRRAPAGRSRSCAARRGCRLLPERGRHPCGRGQGSCRIGGRVRTRPPSDAPDPREVQRALLGTAIPPLQFRSPAPSSWRTARSTESKAPKSSELAFRARESSGMVSWVGCSSSTKARTAISVLTSSSAGRGMRSAQSVVWSQDMGSFASLCLRRPVVCKHFGSPLLGAGSSLPFPLRRGEFRLTRRHGAGDSTRAAPLMFEGRRLAVVDTFRDARNAISTTRPGQGDSPAAGEARDQPRRLVPRLA